MDLNNLRQEYSQRTLDVDSVDSCPMKQFEIWFQEASGSDILEPNAMVLSTLDCGDGQSIQPTQRTVLLKYFDESGLVFFTNYGSRKAIQIGENQNVSVLFPWYALQRQVEINGVAEKVAAAESLKYFALRPRGSQLGAWVSEQSTVVSGRSLLKTKLAELKKKFASGEVPMPSSWGGYRIRPLRFEFWQGGRNRIHDRIEYIPRENAVGENRAEFASPSWIRQRLAP